MIAVAQVGCKVGNKGMRPMGIVELSNVIGASGSIRRGTRLRGAFPEFEWQAFDRDGQFIAPVNWKAVANWTAMHGTAAVSEAAGVNR